MSSLTSVLHDKILNEIRNVEIRQRFKPLIVDKHSEELLYSVCDKLEVLDASISYIANINDVKPAPDSEALYLLMPTNQNVDRVISHFSGGRKMFAKVHLYFTEGSIMRERASIVCDKSWSGMTLAPNGVSTKMNAVRIALPESLFKRLTNSPACDFLARLSELHINFFVKESQVFIANLHSAFFSMYCPPPSQRDVFAAREFLTEDLKFTSRVIANACITLNEFPFIRYYSPSHHAPLGVLAPQYSDPSSSSSSSTTEPYAPRQPASRYQPSPGPSTSSLALGAYAENTSKWAAKLSSRAGSLARSYGSDSSSAQEASGGDHVSKVLAGMVLEALEEYKKANPDWPRVDTGDGRARPRGTLLITDRAMDTITPFVHEFTYQAMAYDLLELKDDQYKYKFVNEKGVDEETSIPINEKDELWVEARHRHMREAIDKLQADFKDFAEKNVAATAGTASLDKLKDMLAALPQFKEQRIAFSKHLSLAEECMKLFEKRKLPEVANIEQCCATGVTPEGKTPKTLVEEMVPLLDSRDVPPMDKARIIALYIQYREGVPEEDRRRLYQHAKLNIPERDAIDNLSLLGTRVTRGPNDKDVRKKIKPRLSSEGDYDLSRYKPLLKTVIEDSVSGKLDQSAFPYLGDSPNSPDTSIGRGPAAAAGPTARPGQRVMPLGGQQPTSLRSAKPNWHKAARAGGGGGGGGGGGYVATKERLLVFVAGGMTYSEMRTAYETSAALNRDVYIGSTHITRAGGQLSASGGIARGGFIDDLKMLQSGGPDSSTMPGGLRGRQVHQGGFQEFYDAKYYEKDSAPPPRGPGGGGASVAGGGGAPGSTGPAGGGARPPMGMQPPSHLTQSDSYSSLNSGDSGGSGKKWKRFFK